MASRDHKPPALERLRPERGAPSREEVNDIQRARIVAAMVEVASELGYIGAAVAPVVARAGVSRRTFYELFDGREDCFLAAFDWGVEQAREAMTQAQESRRSWRERARHALAALLVLLDSEPELARVCMIEALAAGKLVLERRAQVLEELIAALGASAPQARKAGEKPLLTADGVIGGAFSVVHGRLLTRPRTGERGAAAGAARALGDERTTTVLEDGRARRAPGALIELHGQLMALIALPYLGPRAAGEELTRPAPPVTRTEVDRVRGDGGRLLERLDMRLTYRTVRCLMFIGAHPGSSNREVADGAEVPDEGQASKLLARLTKLELIANGQAHGPGLPNRWTLTAHGQHVLSAIHGR